MASASILLFPLTETESIWTMPFIRFVAVIAALSIAILYIPFVIKDLIAKMKTVKTHTGTGAAT